MPITQQTRHLRGSVFGGRRARRVPTWRRGVDDSDGDPDERISFAPPQEQCPSPTDTSIGSSSEVSGNVTVREAHWVRAKAHEPADRPAPRHLWPQHNSTQMESMRSTKARRSMPSTDENKTNRIPEGDALIGVGVYCVVIRGLSCMHWVAPAELPNAIIRIAQVCPVQRMPSRAGTMCRKSCRAVRQQHRVLHALMSLLPWMGFRSIPRVDNRSRRKSCVNTCEGRLEQR